MKAVTAHMLFFGLLALATPGQAQNGNTEKKTIKQVDQVNRTSEEINQTAANTSAALKSTVENSKETLKTIGTLFGNGKKTKKQEKGTVSIAIQQIEYDNEYLNSLFNHVSKLKGVKNPNKRFKNGNASINLGYKSGADALWQLVPKDIRDGFAVLEIDDNSMLLHSKND